MNPNNNSPPLDILSLLDLLPSRVTTAEIEALAHAIDPELKEITTAINETVIMPVIKQLPENLVDLLAWQLHVDFYEPLGLDLDLKRLLVENSIRWHMHKGTKYVLEDMIRILFFENFKIEEWFEYNGEPGYFRLVARETLRTKERYIDMLRAIHELKNERSWLDSVRFEHELENSAFFGKIAKHTRRFLVETKQVQTEIATADMYIGSTATHTRRFVVKSRKPQPKPVQINIATANKHTRRYSITTENRAVYIQSTNFVATYTKHARRYAVVESIERS